MASSMACVRADTGADDVDDGLGDLPDDVLLDVLSRLVTAGDVYTAGRTSILSRRWRQLPRYQIPDLSLDVGDFYPDAGWFPAAALAKKTWGGGRRHSKKQYQAYQHHATAGFIGALWSFLAPPPSARVIGALRLKMILTKYELIRRVGRLVGEAKRSGRIKKDGAVVELELLTEKTNLQDAEDEPAEVMLGYGALFTRFQRGCPRAFRALTSLSVENLWFEDPAAVSDLVRRCVALEFLSMRFCGFDPAAAMAVDLPPESRLRTLLCVECHVPGVDLVRAHGLVELHCGWRLIDGAPPASFGHAPELRKLTLHYQQYEDQEEQWLLSEFLINIPRQLEVLTLSFEFTKIWVQPEAPKYLREVFGRLKELHLEKIHPSCNLSWTIFLLEAAPLLETLHVKVLNHACSPDWHKKLAPSDTDHSEATAPSPGFTHRRLKEVAIRRAFHVARDAAFVRTVVEMAVNLERVTLGVEELGCKACAAAEARRPELARSRCRPGAGADGDDDHDALVERIMGGLASSARITIL